MNTNKNLAVAAMLWALLGLFNQPSYAQEVVVLNGVDDVIGWLESENWWGEGKRGAQLEVPHAMITGFTDRWRSSTMKMPVAQKKEIFYRLMLPLVMHANSLVLKRRDELHQMQAKLETGEDLSLTELRELREFAVLLRIVDVERAETLGPSKDELIKVIDQALYKLDVIPAGLVLGQAAYESGYGTSRFAVKGNALFGQWTYGGKGLVPEQQRKNLGDHRIASFDWPFDSVRGYYINLSSHPAYEDFRRLRAAKRAAGEPLGSMELADGLVAYSERGQKYVDTLKGIMRVNKLTVADDAVFRDEPIKFLVGAESEEKAVELRREVEEMRATGELSTIIARMRLE